MVWMERDGHASRTASVSGVLTSVMATGCSPDLTLISVPESALLTQYLTHYLLTHHDLLIIRHHELRDGTNRGELGALHNLRLQVRFLSHLPAQILNSSGLEQLRRRA
jgi:hypothetical protein